MLRKSPSSIVAAFGTATLVAGTIAGLAPGCLTAPGLCTIILTRNTPAGTLGFLSAPVAARGALSTTFSITSSNAAETSTVNWMAIPRISAAAGVPSAGPFRRAPSGRFLTRGRATLVAGTVTVSTGQMFGPFPPKIFAMTATIGGLLGKLSVPIASINSAAGTFIINSNSATDTSTVDWFIVDEAPKSSPSGPFLYQSGNTLVAGLSTFTGAPAIDSSLYSIVASVIDFAGTPDNLTSPVVNRSATGTFSVNSNNGADTSTIEAVVI